MMEMLSLAFQEGCGKARKHGAMWSFKKKKKLMNAVIQLVEQKHFSFQDFEYIEEYVGFFLMFIFM